MDYLEGLNEPQREAVLQSDGPIMIIAGAGSGKTRVLTMRIAHLMHKGVDPFNIMALTFTNKAAREMRNRIENIFGSDARSLWMGTFHSIFARILRVESEKIGYPSNFTIYDTDDSKNLIKSILKENDLDDKVYKPGSVLGRISAAKNKLISWQEYLANPLYRADDEAAMKPRLGDIYKTYQQRLFKAGAMDFDDLLFNTHALFKNHVDVLNKYQHRFHYVMVDEFQDTNLSQYLITRKLSARYQNICVVGDDAQSIYAFRGADIQNILNFEKDYPDLKIFKLEQNYRSTSTIVNAANSIISKNRAQLKKNVWTSNEDGNLIELIKANSDSEEAKLVATGIFEEKMRDQVQNKDFAILYRTNSQSRALEESLRRINIKYRVFGGVSFYQRKEVKDILAYLRFILNPNDEQSLKRIINLPKRGIGDTSINKLVVVAVDNNVGLWEALQHANRILPARASSLIEDFVTLIRKFQITAQSKDAFETTMEVAKTSGLLRELYNDKSVEGVARYENVQELLNGIKEFIDNPEITDKSLGAYLQDIALLTDSDNERDPDKDYVSIMTLHMAKGLEFRHVYIVGLEEDLFPSQMMLSSRSDLEEERRLFYVGVTRAEKKLSLCYAVTRYRFGRLKPCEPSRFLSDVDARYLKVNRSFVKDEMAMNTERVFRFKSRTPPPAPRKTNYVPPADFVPSDTSSLKEGMKVEHPRFGFGIVKELDIQGSDRKARVLFDDFGEKTLMLSFAKIRIHSD